MIAEHPWKSFPRAPRRPGSPARTALDSYYAEIRGFRVLSRADEAALAREVRQQRPGAQERLVESSLQFVVSIVREYRNLGMPIEDLINEGNLGLMEAARRFDPERGTKFISFAVWWVRKAIRSALNEQRDVVRLPVSQVKRISIVRATERALEDDLGRRPTRDELSANLPSNLAAVDPIHRHGIRSTSLDAPADRKERYTVAEMLADDEHPSIEARMLKQEMLARLSASYAQLDDRQRTVIFHRFGLGGLERLTLGEIGRRVGLSREGVRLIEGKAIKRLRKILETDEARASRFLRGPATRDTEDDCEPAA